MAKIKFVEHSEFIEKILCMICAGKKIFDVLSLFQVAFAPILGRIARTDEPAYITGYFNRTNRKMLSAQGMFVNQVVIRADMTQNVSAADLIQAVAKGSKLSYKMKCYPSIHLSKELGITP